MASDEEGLAPPQEPEVPGVQIDGISVGGVRHPDFKTEVLDTRVSALPAVSVAGRAVEIRGDAAELVIEVLEDWVRAQNRRIELIRRGGTDAEGRRQVQAIMARTSVAYRLLQAWEGVLTVPRAEVDFLKPEN